MREVLIHRERISTAGHTGGFLYRSATIRHGERLRDGGKEMNEADTQRTKKKKRADRKLPASTADTHARPNERTVRRHGPVTCSWRHLCGNLDAGGARPSRGPIRTAVLTLGRRRPAAPWVRETVHLREGVAEAVELAVEFDVVDLVYEVQLAHFEERGRREERI